MKHPRMLLLTGVAALSLATAVFAQNKNAGPSSDGGPDAQREGRPGNRPPIAPLIAAIDANHDGTISAEEIANAPAALKTLDKNGDGVLNREDAMVAREERRGDRGGDQVGGADRPGNGQQRRMGPPEDREDKQGPPPSDQNGNERPAPGLLGQLDTNHDRTLSPEEIAAAPAVLKKLDTNGDGSVTRDELRALFPRPRGGQNRPDGDGPPPPPEDEN